MPPGYSIRLMHSGEEERLLQIDIEATVLFATVEDRKIAGLARCPPATLEQFAEILNGCLVHVVTDIRGQPCGFVAADTLDDNVYIRQLSVVPQATRKGLGSALLQTVIADGRKQGLSKCMLSTFRNVAFNDAFYRTQGFVELPLVHASNRVADRFMTEIPENIDPEQRLLMILTL